MQKRAFTLIELLVVIAIIGILSSIVLISLRGARYRAFDAEVKTEIEQIRNEAEMFYATNNTYNGFQVPSQYKPPYCSSNSYTTSSNSTYDMIAICAKLCSTSQYWCVDSEGNALATGSCPAAGVGKCK